MRIGSASAWVAVMTVGVTAGFFLVGCGQGSGSGADGSTGPNAAAAAPDAKAAAGNAQTNCPIMGGKINRAIFADYQGKRVYFCCGMCPAEFNKDPAKYVKALEDKGIVLDKTPETDRQGRTHQLDADADQYQRLPAHGASDRRKLVDGSETRSSSWHLVMQNFNYDAMDGHT
jgi:YHS domain-containing protein